MTATAYGFGTTTSKNTVGIDVGFNEKLQNAVGEAEGVVKSELSFSTKNH